MPSDQELLEDVVAACQLAIEFLGRTSRQQFLSDVHSRSAVNYQIILIGEASKGISQELREHAWHISFAEAAAMRDFLVHQYRRTDPARVWQTVTDDLPTMLYHCEAQLVRPRREEQPNDR